MRVPKISVIGDVMVDIENIVSGVREREGRQNLYVSKTLQRLGAAGAVANMVAAMGLEAALFGTANNRQIQTIRHLAPGFCHILGHKEQTLVRERFFLEDGTPVGPRIDRGAEVVLCAADQRLLASQAISGASAVIVCDHACGMVGSELMKYLRGAGVPVFVDPHPESNYADFGGVECICANRNEAIGIGEVHPDPEHVIQKLDSDGLWWYRKGWRSAAQGDESFRTYHASICEKPVDTLGAGDQFIAALAVARMRRESWERAVFLANIAAGLQCERRGIVPVTWAEIEAKAVSWVDHSRE